MRRDAEGMVNLSGREGPKERRAVVKHRVEERSYSQIGDGTTR